MSSELKEFVKEMEGLRLMPYRCPAGKLTIGYGHNLEGNGISKEVAEELLVDDLTEASLATSKLIPVTDQVWFNIATDMVFNMGLTKFKTFMNLIKHINAGSYDNALAEMVNSLWFSQVGRRSKLLWLAGHWHKQPYEVYADFAEVAKTKSINLNLYINEMFKDEYVKWYKETCSPFYRDRPKLAKLYKDLTK